MGLQYRADWWFPRVLRRWWLNWVDSPTETALTERIMPQDASTPRPRFLASPSAKTRAAGRKRPWPPWHEARWMTV